MFEFLLSIRVSFPAVRVGRMPRRCAATPTKGFFEIFPLLSSRSHRRKLHFRSLSSIHHLATFLRFTFDSSLYFNIKKLTAPHPRFKMFLQWRYLLYHKKLKSKTNVITYFSHLNLRLLIVFGVNLITPRERNISWHLFAFKFVSFCSFDVDVF